MDKPIKFNSLKKGKLKRVNGIYHGNTLGSMNKCWMETVKKNIGSLTFKWKKNKIKGNIGSYADKEGET